MKKQKLGLNKLNLSKSRIAELNSLNAKGGIESTNPQCIFTGVLDGCDVTANGCNGTNGCPPRSTQCNPTATRQIFSCLYPC